MGLHVDAAEAAVALLAEGVDRNGKESAADMARTRSPSSRRAWIEIMTFPHNVKCAGVALLAEGVDRNILMRAMVSVGNCRPPRGGRG